MGIIERLIGYAIAAVVALLLGWWFWDSIIGAIRAPVKAELVKAQEANESLVTAKEKAEAETARLNVILATRTDREAKADRKLERMNNALDKLASIKPEVRAWTDTVIPPDIIIMRQLVPENGGQGNSGQVRNPDQPDGTHKPAATAGSGFNQQPIVEKSGDAGNAGESLQREATGRSKLEAKPTLSERIKKAWGN